MKEKSNAFTFEIFLLNCLSKTYKTNKQFLNSFFFLEIIIKRDRRLDFALPEMLYKLTASQLESSHSDAKFKDDVLIPLWANLPEINDVKLIGSVCNDLCLIADFS